MSKVFLGEAATLNPAHEPRIDEFALPEGLRTDAILGAGSELLHHARSQKMTSWGFYPEITLPGSLPRNERLRKLWPLIQVGQRQLLFSFTRVALKPQTNQTSYHVDAGTNSGFAEDTDSTGVSLPDSEAWRVILNFHEAFDRTIKYLDVPVDHLELVNADGYIHPIDAESIDSRHHKEIIVPKRKGATIFGAVICVSKVAHSGRDAAGEGLFIAAFGPQQGGQAR